MIRDGHVSTSLSSRIPSGTDLCKLWECCLSPFEFMQGLCKLLPFLWVHLHINHADLEGLVFLVSSHPTGFCSLSSFSSKGLPECLGKESDGNIPFKAECSKSSHSLLNVWLWVLDVFAPLCYRRKLFWWCLSHGLIYEYSRKSLRVISTAFHFVLSRTVVLVLPQFPGLSSLRFSVTLAVLSHGVVLQWSQILANYSTNFVPPLH